VNRRIVLVAVAVVLALIGTLAVYSYAHNADKRVLNKTRSATVLIVQKAIPVGTSWDDAIKGGYFKQEREPIGSVPDNAIADLNASIPVAEVANSPLQPGTVALRSMFASQTAVTGALAIPKGLMAVTVSISQDSAVAGFVQPQSEVAIFVTAQVKGYQSPPGSTTVGTQDLTVTKLLLSRVSVLAVSQQPTTALTGKNGATTNGANVLVTLALTQTQAERLILSAHVATVTMGLLTDTSVTGDDNGQKNGNDQGQIGVCVCTPTPVFVK